VLSGRGLCDGLITFTEASNACLSVLSFVCCQVEVGAMFDPLYRGVVWMSVCCECFVLSGRSQCDGLISCTEGSY